MQIGFSNKSWNFATDTDDVIGTFLSKNLDKCKQIYLALQFKIAGLVCLAV